MKNILAIIILLGFGTSCVQEKNELKGTWVNSDFSYPETIAFGDSLWSTSTFGHSDSLPYYLTRDSIFFQGYFSPELIKYGYRISGDTLWTTFKADSQNLTTQYFKPKSKHFINDFIYHLGIDLNLPKGYSVLVGSPRGNPIYLPDKKQTDSNYKLFLNNNQLTLDTLFHEKLFKLLEQDKSTYFNVFCLYIDSKIEYSAVKLLKNELRKVRFYNVAYISNPADEKYYESNTGLRNRLFPIFESEKYYINPDIKKIVDSRRPPPPTPPKEFFEEPDLQKSNVCKVEIIDNQILLNEHKFSPDILYEKIKKDNSLIIYLNVDNGSNYETYYSFISTYVSIRQEIKNKLSVELHKTEYDELIDYEKIKKVNSLCTYRLIEN